MSPVVKKPKEKFHMPAKYVLLIITALCAALLILTYTTPLVSGPFERISNVLVVPFQKGVSHIGSWIVEKADQIAKIRTLEEENSSLRQQVSELTEENTTLQQERYELTELRELYSLDEQYPDYEKTGARIIAKDSGNWYHSFVIDKGSSDGIETDMNVIASGGLVGRVTKVDDNWASVISIIDDNSNVSAQVLSTGDTLIVSGDLEAYSEGAVNFSRLTDRADQVSEGDKIVTSSISGKYLPGILIGYVQTITRDSNNLTKSGTISTAVDFEHLDTVLVIMQKKQNTGESGQEDDS